jgi:hypothetical protein
MAVLTLLLNMAIQNTGRHELNLSEFIAFN